MPGPDTLWALVDCNNFFAACEQIFRPDLRERPVVVLSSNDGCVIARSPEAKALDIPMGAPWFKVRGRLESRNVAIFSANFAFYGDISSRIMRSLAQLCPRFEQYSIDEAFLQLDGAARSNLRDFCASLRETVLRWTGVTVSVGVGASPTLAKLANHIAKGEPRFGGLFSLARAEADIDRWLAKTPVGEIWGIGKAHRQRLLAEGIVNALDLKRADDNLLRRRLGVAGWHTALELRGISCQTSFERRAEERRSIARSRTFGRRIYELAELAEAVASFTADCAARLRRMDLVAGAIQVRIRTSRHDETVYANAASAVLPAGTDDSQELIARARELLGQIYAPGQPYAKAGVMLWNIEEKRRRQKGLFERDRPRSERLMRALDAINARYGRQGLRYGAMGLGQRPWEARQAMRSPDYTGSWQDLPVAACGR